MNRITGSILILHGRAPKIVLQPFRVQLYRMIANQTRSGLKSELRRSLASEAIFGGAFPGLVGS
jgi:hypothetical protein